MSRDFDGVDDVIAATITGITGNMTMGAWINVDGSGEGTAGRIFDDGTASFNMNTNATDLRFSYGGGGAAGTAAAVIAATGTWYCVAARYDNSNISIVTGSRQAAMTAASMSSTTSGASAAIGTALKVGNRTAGDRTFDGRIARFFIVPWRMTVDELERFRCGDMTVLYDHGAPRIFLPLDSPDAATAYDLSGAGAHGTVTGCAYAEGPPSPMRW